MTFILSVDSANRNTEYFQATSDETVLDLKHRYCTKHGLALDKVTVFVNENQLKETDTLAVAKVDMFTTVTMKVEGLRPVIAEVSKVHHDKPMMASALKPWSADGKARTGFLGLF